MLRTLRLLSISFALLIMLSGLSSQFPTRAQSSGSTTGSIVGRVTDPQGAVLVGAMITATQIETNLVRVSQADGNGIYRFVQAPPGNYEIRVQADGFVPGMVKLTLTIGTTARADFTLSVGGANELVEVKATGVIDEDKTESSTTIDRQRIDSLPINRRNYLDFTLTTPRVVTDGVSDQSTPTSGLSFDGQSARFNNFTIDGLDNNDRTSGTVRATFSQDAVQEFQVVSDSYSAEFGRAIGGIVNIVTRGGSNQFQGSLFFFNRNDKISARDVFASFKPPYSQYQFGSVMGGPIKRDKLFFFTSFERLSIKQNNIVTISDEVVSAARRQGFPLSNGPVPFSVGTTTALGRTDWRLATNDTLWVRYNFGGTYNGAFESFNGFVGESAGSIQKLNDHSIAANNSYISTGLNLVNETRFLYSRNNLNLVPLGDGPEVNIVAPEGSITFGRNPALPQARVLNVYQVVDNVTLTRGRNQIKFGVDFQYFNTPPGTTTISSLASGVVIFTPLDFSELSGIPNLPFFTGLQSFDPASRTPEQRAFLMVLSALLPSSVPGFPKGVPLADLALPVVYVQGFGDPSLITRGDLFSLFLQDDIKLSPNLLLKAGLRYDLNRARFIPKNNGNLSPRVALSYHPTHLPKLSLHAAYGVFFGASLTVPTFAVQVNKIKTPFIQFPFSVLPFASPGHHIPASEQLPPGVPFIPQVSLNHQFDPNLRNSYTQQASLSFSYLLGTNTEVSLSYSYVRGIKLFALRNINPVVRPIPGDPLQSEITGRIDPTRGEVEEFESAFDSYYHGLTISINRRFAKRLGFLAHYTFSKAIDNFADIRPDTQEVDDPLRPGNERGLSLQDARSRFVASGIWELSYTKNRLFRGFQISEILNLNSGRPYNLLAGVDLNMNGDNGIGDRPPGLGRNVGIEPGFANFDLRLQRTATIRDRYHLQGFAEIFNLFNRVNISGIDRVFPPDEQGQFNLPPKSNGRFIAPRDRYRSAFAPRQLQVGLRLVF